MNKDNALQFIPLVQALAAGKTIQLLYPNGKWIDMKEPGFNSSVGNYRIKPEPKPEPREYWIPVFNDGSSGFARPEEAYRRDKSSSHCKEWVHVREVIGDEK